MTDQQLVDIETRIAFLEDTVNTLNTMVHKQNEEIRQYKDALKSLSKHIKQVQSDISVTPQDEAPPHY